MGIVSQGPSHVNNLFLVDPHQQSDHEQWPKLVVDYLFIWISLAAVLFVKKKLCGIYFGPSSTTVTLANQLPCLKNQVGTH